MSTQSPPWPPPISGQTYRFAANTGTWQSPVTGKRQGVARLGGKWEFDVSFAILDDARSAQWRAFMVNCSDQFLPFYWGLYPKGLPRNYATGWDVGTPAWGSAPVIDTASQTGWSVKVKSLSAGAVLLAGDGIAFNNGTFRELHYVTADVTADGSGKATVSIAPQIQISPADAATVYLDGNCADVTKRCATEVIFADSKQAAIALSGFQVTASIKLVQFP